MYIHVFIDPGVPYKQVLLYTTRSYTVPMYVM